MDFLPVMELHLLLGVTNRLYDHLDTVLVESGSSLRAKDWAFALSLKRPEMHSGEFNGDQCRKLLRNIDKLEDLLNADDTAVPEQQKAFSPLRDFERVRQGCFGNELHYDYKQSINSFETSYLSLGIPVTSKVHAVFDHISQFMDNQANSEEQLGLGYRSEQASEAVHTYFQNNCRTWAYKRELNHPECPQKLLKCTVTYCSRHM